MCTNMLTDHELSSILLSYTSKYTCNDRKEYLNSLCKSELGVVKAKYKALGKAFLNSDKESGRLTASRVEPRVKLSSLCYKTHRDGGFLFILLVNAIS